MDIGVSVGGASQGPHYETLKEAGEIISDIINDKNCDDIKREALSTLRSLFANNSTNHTAINNCNFEH